MKEALNQLIQMKRWRKRSMSSYRWGGEGSGQRFHTNEDVKEAVNTFIQKKTWRKRSTTSYSWTDEGSGHWVHTDEEVKEAMSEFILMKKWRKRTASSSTAWRRSSPNKIFWIFSPGMYVDKSDKCVVECFKTSDLDRGYPYPLEVWNTNAGSMGPILWDSISGNKVYQV